jgi:hypothetical protein
MRRQTHGEYRGVHVMVIDGVFTRDADAGVLFHPATAPTREELDAIVRRVRDRSLAWLRRHGWLDERPLDERSNEPPAQTALDACAAIAIGRGRVATLPNAEGSEDDHEEAAPSKLALAVEHDGFNVHAGVCIDAGDALGRERLARYGARPPLSVERIRRLPGGRVAYRLKYVSRGRGKHRIMSAMEFMARLAALIAPERAAQDDIGYDDVVVPGEDHAADSPEIRRGGRHPAVPRRGHRAGRDAGWGAPDGAGGVDGPEAGRAACRSALGTDGAPGSRGAAGACRLDRRSRSREGQPRSWPLR